MKITIGYSSKYSNSFSNKETKEITAISLKAIANDKEAKQKGKKVVLNENDGYEDIMYKINDVFPNFQYSPITKNTVLGVMSRLLGEVRYLNKFIHNEPEHIVNKLDSKITFKVFNREIFNEMIRITTPEKESPNGGGGVISEQSMKNIILSYNEYSEILYSVFNIVNLEILEKFIVILENATEIKTLKNFFVENGLLYYGGYEPYKFIEMFEKNSKTTSVFDGELRKVQKGKKETSPQVERYTFLLKKIGKLNYGDEEYHFKPTSVNLSGILVYLFSKFLIRNKYSIVGNFIEKSGKIKGIAEASGGLTTKDFYSTFTGEVKISADSPYFLKSGLFDKKANKEINQGDFSIGATKEDGFLEIYIDVPEEEAIELKERINAVAVSSFQMGKKGLAYIKRIDLYE
ncbi:hypothetical protein [Serratia sp. Se-RSBMAAmG]|uniref:hypothetical protein n=1 Tax=Serratia sp. Se-RSBMAAmG TaxID=3043305 RepID=UPI0024AEB91F|nr:hypothetical protein [Serratia sp. Se-RSBMAAmG]MDI6977118.1 hypothetical protein [Serratia sp. Se-RSBMAAmG]